MLAKRPSARWTGVIDFPEIAVNVDGGLYSIYRRKRAPLFALIHRNCQTLLKDPTESEEIAETAVRAKKSQSITQVAQQIFCPNCNRYLKSDEIARAVESELGLLQISDVEYEALLPKPQKRVSARLAKDPTNVLTMVGIGRRFYLMPKSNSVNDYYVVYEVLRRANKVGFIPELVIAKRSYSVVIRPILVHPSIFGRCWKLLVAEEIADTDALRDPLEYQLLPASVPALNKTLSVKVSLAKKTDYEIKPEDCINPQRLKLKNIIEDKLRKI